MSLSGLSPNHIHNGSPPQLRVVPPPDWAALGRTEHAVQFYQDDDFLVRALAGFVRSCIVRGETALIIVTEAHQRAVDDQLRRDGLDPEAARASGHYYSPNAGETLAKFMVDGLPDARLFKQVVGSVVARLSQETRPLRAFGEMVALLWQQGNTDAAMRLEALWNELMEHHTFSLVCAYPLDGFYNDSEGKPFSHVCQAHSRVLPAESYSCSEDTDEQLRAIALLQQRAASLEAEISRRKLIEKELARQKRELSDFLQNASEGIHQVALEGKILWANHAELELLGYTAEEYIGHNIREFHVDAEVIDDILQRLGRGESLHDYEARLSHKDGSIRYVSIHSNVCWDGEEFRYTRCFTRDITERKRAAEILERTVAVRTEQLRETVAELEAFSYSISHDMRSPLRAMQGFAKAILEDYSSQLPAEALDYLQRIQRASNRLDLLVRDVLAYSKVAKEQIDLKPVALRPLIEDIIQQNPALQKSARHISVEGPLQTVLGHEAYLTQCLSNLIENGLKFVAPGATPNVTIRGELSEREVRINVVDNGIGIGAEHHDRIFKIFGRVYPEKRYPGTGIGLAIVRKAVARMGGETGFDSKPGEGSTFWFTLQVPNGH